jgi:hypothetical protein
MSKIGRYSAQRRKSEVLSGTKTLAVADCGTMFTVGSATGAITLPTVAQAGAGWWCEFWVNDITAACVITAPGTDLILGHVSSQTDNVETQLHPATDIPTEVLTFTTSVVKGDWARLWCDGTNYFVTGQSRIVDAITLVAE